MEQDEPKRAKDRERSQAKRDRKKAEVSLSSRDNDLIGTKASQ
jgi:hypothetical protein